MRNSWTVAPGDTLSKIAQKSYGDPAQWPKIVRANPQLSARTKAIDGSPLILVGDVLVVPQEADLSAEDTAAAQNVSSVVMNETAAQDFSLKINGKNFTGWTGWTLVENVSGVDGFSVASTWNEKNAEQKAAFMPFSFAETEARFEGGLIFKGRIMPATPAVGPQAQTITVQGQPLCGALINSDLPPSLFPAEFSGLNLKEIAKTVCGPFGVSVKSESDVGDAFDKVSAEVDEKAWDFLQKLADQRGLFLTNTPEGKLLIYKPKIEDVSASFKQGEAPFVSCVPQFDGEKIYSHITGWTKTTAENDSEKYTYENKSLTKRGILRCHGEAIEDATGSSLENSVKALAGKMYANCVKYSLTVSKIKDADGKLYRKNMAVSVLAPGAGIYRETKFLVDGLTLSRDDRSGEKTVFTLVLPESRNGDLPEAFPWEE